MRIRRTEEPIIFSREFKFGIGIWNLFVVVGIIDLALLTVIFFSNHSLHIMVVKVSYTVVNMFDAMRIQLQFIKFPLHAFNNLFLVFV